jgi:endonuclease-3
MLSTKSRSAPVPEVLARLEHLYGDASCSLDYGRPLELLAATILSAQCTDARVNMVTPELFRRFPTAASLAAAPPGAIEEVIRSTGFFNAKAKSLRGMARALVEKHAGEVPHTMAELHALPGVGRKTANVVLGNVWHAPDGVVVDTHVGRLARRLGWTKHADPVKAEQDLNRAIPKERWTWISHALILHGRRICSSQRPKCDLCTLADLCPKIGVESKEEREKAKRKRKTRISSKVKKAEATGATRRARPAKAVNAHSKKLSAASGAASGVAIAKAVHAPSKKNPRSRPKAVQKSPVSSGGRR